MVFKDMYFAGLEGGTTSSRAIILDINGTLLGKAEGPHTNQWMIGLESAARRIVDLIESALTSAKLPTTTKLGVLGLALSGVDTVENQNSVIAAIKKISPDLATCVHAENDTYGTKFTATDSTCIVLIAGTGSNCRLIDEESHSIDVGGLGYKLGDEGSAYSIALNAVKYYLDCSLGLVLPSFDLTAVSECIRAHFGLESHLDLLKSFYPGQFDKTHVAKLCRSLAEAAQAGDPFTGRLFHRAGHDLGRMTATAMRRKYGGDGKACPREIQVACCGSVFKSWPLMQEGFLQGLAPHYPQDLTEFTVVLETLNETAAYGAAIVAAKLEKGIALPRPPNVLTVIARLPCPPRPLQHVCHLTERFS